MFSYLFIYSIFVAKYTQVQGDLVNTDKYKITEVRKTFTP